MTPVLGIASLAVALALAFGTTSLARKEFFYQPFIQEMARHMALHIAPPVQTLHAHKAFVLITDCLPHHNEEVEFEKDTRVLEDLVGEPSHGRLVDAKVPGDTSRRSTLFHPPQYKAFLLRGEPGVSVFRLTDRRVAAESFVQGFWRHKVEISFRDLQVNCMEIAM